MVDLRGPLRNAARQVRQAAEISYLQTGNTNGSNVTYFYKDYADLVKVTRQLDPDGDYKGFIYTSLDLLLEGMLDPDLQDDSYRSLHLAYKQAKEIVRDYVNRGVGLTGDKGQYLPRIHLAIWGEFLVNEHRLSYPVVRSMLLEILRERNLEAI